MKRNVPLISVIIPVYNAERYLKKCLESISSQTIFNELEVIFINDGSLDKSGDILDKFSISNKNVIVKHINNSGVSNARNVGIEISSAEYISFIDSDDYLDKDFFECLISEVDKQTDIIGCGFVAEYSDKTVNHSSNKKLILNKKMAIKEFLLEKNIDPNVTSKIFRKSVIGNLRFDNSLSIAEDRWFLFNCLNKIRYMKFIPEAKYHYVMNDSSACRRKFSKKNLDAIIVANRITELVKEKYNEYLGLAECGEIDAKCRVCGDIYSSKALDEYLDEYTVLIKSIKKFSTIKKIKYSSKKHTLAFISMKISPLLYCFIKNNMKFQYK